jgi:NAD(P)-dependent dehydrogenase (short-subunit alcohol dehydrogenase family)
MWCPKPDAARQPRTRRQVIERLPIGRMGTPTDIAQGIVFLASDDAAFMTGAGLVIDGGTTAQ